MPDSISTIRTSIRSTQKSIEEAVVGEMSGAAKKFIELAAYVPVVGRVIAKCIYEVIQNHLYRPEKKKELIEESCKEAYTKVTLNDEKQRTLQYQSENGSQVTYTETINTITGDHELWMDKNGDSAQHHFSSIAQLQAYRRKDIHTNGQTYSEILPAELQGYLRQAQQCAHINPFTELEQIYREASTEVTQNDKRQSTLSYTLGNDDIVTYTEEKDNLSCYYYGGLHGGLQDKGDDFPKTIVELQKLRRSCIAENPELYQPRVPSELQAEYGHLQSLWITAQGLAKLDKCAEDVTNLANHSNQISPGILLSDTAENTNLTLPIDFKEKYGVQDHDFLAVINYLKSVNQSNNEIMVNGLQLLKLALLHNKLCEIGYVDFKGADLDILLQMAETLCKDAIQHGTSVKGASLNELFSQVVKDWVSAVGKPDCVGWFYTLARVYGLTNENAVQEAGEAILPEWREASSVVDYFSEVFKIKAVPITVVLQADGVYKSEESKVVNIRLFRFGNAHIMILDGLILTSKNGTVQIEHSKTGCITEADDKTATQINSILAHVQESKNVSSELLMELRVSAENCLYSLRKRRFNQVSLPPNKLR